MAASRVVLLLVLLGAPLGASADLMLRASRDAAGKADKHFLGTAPPPMKAMEEKATNDMEKTMKKAAKKDKAKMKEDMEKKKEERDEKKEENKEGMTTMAPLSTMAPLTTMYDPLMPTTPKLATLDHLHLKELEGLVEVDDAEALHPPYIYEPADPTKRLEVLSEPHRAAMPVDKHDITDGEVLLVTDKQVSANGDVFLKLPTHDGWVLVQKKGGEGSEPVRPLRLPEWQCQTSAGGPIQLLKHPDYDAMTTGQHLEPGAKFLAIEQVVGQDGVLYVKPVFKEGFVASTQCKYLPSEMWRYDPEVTDAPVKPLPILSQPHLAAEPTGVHLPAPSTFYVDSKHAGDHQTVFVKPRGEAGYVYDKSPEQKHARIFKVGVPSQWIYKPSGHKPLKVMPDLEHVEDASDDVHVKIVPNQVFEVIGQETGPDGVKYHELADGRGFVPTKDTAAWAPASAGGMSLMVPVIGVAVAVIVAAVLYIVCMPRNQMEEKRTFEVRPPPAEAQSSQPEAVFEEVAPPPSAKAAPEPEAPKVEVVPEPQPQPQPQPEETPLVGPDEPKPVPAEPTMSMWFQDKGAKDDQGIREYRFTHRPLGLQFKLRAPIVINGYTADGTGRDLGVKMGSTLVAIGGDHAGEVIGTKTDVRNKNYEEIWELLKNGCTQIPARDGVIDYMGSVKKKPRSRSNSPSTTRSNSRENTQYTQ